MISVNRTIDWNFEYKTWVQKNQKKKKWWSKNREFRPYDRTNVEIHIKPN